MNKLVILYILISLFSISLYSQGYDKDPIGKKYGNLPFVPTSNFDMNKVVELEFQRRWEGRDTFHLTHLPYKKIDNKLEVKVELHRRARGEVRTKNFTTNNTNVYTYLREVLDINVDRYTSVSIEKSKYCDFDINMDGSPKLHTYDSGRGTDCIFIYFIANGESFFFSGDPKAYFAAGIFLRDDVPLVGLRHARFFPLINEGGKYVQPSGIAAGSYLTLGARAFGKTGSKVVFDKEFSRYIKSDLPASALFPYSVNNSPTPNPPSVSSSDLKLGDRVLAKWKKIWFVGTIQKISGTKASIHFLDGDKSEVNLNTEVKAFDWVPGKQIECRDPHDNKWSKGEIRRISGDQVSFLFSGADLPQSVGLDKCRE